MVSTSNSPTTDSGNQAVYVRRDGNGCGIIRCRARHCRWCRVKRGRLATGQGLLEAVIIGIVFVLFAAAAALLVIDSGLLLTYKLKLQALALNGAQYASSLSPDDPQFDQKVSTYTLGHVYQSRLYSNPLFTPCHSDQAIVLASMGAAGRALAGPPVTVTATHDAEFRTVTIQARNLPLLTSLPFVPSKVDLEDTEASTPTLAANGYLMLEWQNANSAPAAITEPARPAFLPILGANLIDTSKPQLMLDTYNWPLTHVICHGVFQGSAPELSFPVYHGSGGGNRASLASREAAMKELVDKIYAADSGNSLWEYPKVICDFQGQMMPGPPCPPPPPPPPAE